MVHVGRTLTRLVRSSSHWSWAHNDWNVMRQSWRETRTMKVDDTKACCRSGCDDYDYGMVHQTDPHGAAVVGDGAGCADCAVGGDASGSVPCLFWLDHDAQDVVGSTDGWDDGNVCGNHAQKEATVYEWTSIADRDIVDAAVVVIAVADVAADAAGGRNACLSGPL